MSIPNVKDITAAIQTLIEDNATGDYIIERNPEQNADQNKARQKSGWIGIYTGDDNYSPFTTGAVPWKAVIAITVELQVASDSGVKSETRMEDGIQDILTVLNNDRTIGGTVDYISGINVQRFVRPENKWNWWYSAIIKLNLEVRA